MYLYRYRYRHRHRTPRFQAIFDRFTITIAIPIVKPNLELLTFDQKQQVCCPAAPPSRLYAVSVRRLMLHAQDSLLQGIQRADHPLNPQPQALAYAHAGSVQQPDYQAFHAFCVIKQLLNFRPTADRRQSFSSFGTRKIAEIADLFFQHFPIQENQRVKRLVLGCAVAWYCGGGISLIGSIARGLGTLSGAEQVNESFISGGGLSKTDKSPKDSPRNCS